MFKVFHVSHSSFRICGNRIPCKLLKAHLLTYRRTHPILKQLVRFLRSLLFDFPIVCGPFVHQLKQLRKIFEEAGAKNGQRVRLSKRLQGEEITRRVLFSANTFSRRSLSLPQAGATRLAAKGETKEDHGAGVAKKDEVRSADGKFFPCTIYHLPRHPFSTRSVRQIIHSSAALSNMPTNAKVVEHIVGDDNGNVYGDSATTGNGHGKSTVRCACLAWRARRNLFHLLIDARRGIIVISRYSHPTFFFGTNVVHSTTHHIQHHSSSGEQKVVETLETAQESTEGNESVVDIGANFVHCENSALLLSDSTRFTVEESKEDEVRIQGSGTIKNQGLT